MLHAYRKTGPTGVSEVRHIPSFSMRSVASRDDTLCSFRLCHFLQLYEDARIV
jgi:hypothetical protein